jgi:hypothetical protein
VENGLQAIVQRLPVRGQEIERLAEESETFLGICEDFADAEAALRHWSAAPPSSTIEARKAEYVTLVEELAIEIEQLLDNAAAAKSKKTRDPI